MVCSSSWCDIYAKKRKQRQVRIQRKRRVMCILIIYIITSMIMKKKIPMLGIRPISYSCAITNCDVKNNAPFISPVMSMAKED